MTFHGTPNPEVIERRIKDNKAKESKAQRKEALQQKLDTINEHIAKARAEAKVTQKEIDKLG